MEQDDWLVLGAAGVAAYYITQGIGKIPGLIVQAGEVAAVNTGNIFQGALNVVDSFAYDFVVPAPVNGNYSFITPDGLTYSSLQTPPSQTYLKNEWGEGSSFDWSNFANPLPANTYTGLNEWGEGTAIITSNQPPTQPILPTSGNTFEDWISGFHLW